MRPVDRPGLAFASMIHPGHPLMLAVSDVLLERHGNLLRQGAVLVDAADDGEEPHLLFLLTHEIKSGDGQVLSKRLQFIRVTPDGAATFAGWAPHLDLEAIAAADRALLKDVLTAPWIRADQEQRAPAGDRRSRAGRRFCRPCQQEQVGSRAGNRRNHLQPRVPERAGGSRHRR